jgi:hypothetical protein
MGNKKLPKAEDEGKDPDFQEALISGYLLQLDEGNVSVVDC